MIYMLIASAGFASMGALVKLSCKSLPTLSVVFGRSIVIVVLVTVLIRARRIPIRIGNWKMMAARCGVGFTAMLCYFWALANAPLASAITLQYSAPIFVVVLGWMLLRERVSRLTVGAIFVAFIGVALLVSPELASFEFAASAAVVSAVLAALAYLAVRKLRETDSAEMVVLAFAVFATIGSSPGLFLFEQMPTTTQWLGLFGVGVCAGIGQLGMTHAYRHAEAAWISAFSYLTVVLGAVYGIVVFDEKLTWLTVVGALLIVGSGVALAIDKKA